jgi:flagellum-specific peptidoglycan hydrolase FlgJ
MEGEQMSYSNSPLVCYTKLSPNNSGTRTHTIDRITPHCVVGQLSTEGILSLFTTFNDKSGASCNYCIGADGRVGLGVPESERSWCSSSRENDQRAITIECASDKTDPYAFRDVVYQKLITLCADICRRNGKKKLLWLGDKAKTLAYTPAADEMVLTVHRWYAAKSCPGDWMYARMGDLAQRVTAILSSENAGNTQNEDINGKIMQNMLTVKDLHGLSEAEKIEKLGPIATADQKETGILASVTMAQMILESGYATTDLAVNANNLFGMKCSLSGNKWKSAWDGIKKYAKRTAEQDAKGNIYYITADFRSYSSISDSFRDHSLYLLGATNGSVRRYPGIETEADYKKAIHIIKAGGYATDTKYEPKICSIIEHWNLTRFDVQQAVGGTSSGSSGTQSQSTEDAYIVQAGYYQDKKNAEAKAAALRYQGIDAFVKEVKQ